MFKKQFIIAIIFPLFSYLTISLCFEEYRQYLSGALTEGDQPDYFLAAKLLYGQLQPHPYRCYGYPVFLGIPEIFGIPQPYNYWPIVLNIFFFILTLYILKQYDDYFNIKIFYISTLFIGLTFGYLIAINRVYTEIGFTMFLISSLLNLRKSLDNPKQLKYLFITFFCIGMACVFRPGTIYFIFFILLFLFIYYFFKRESIKHITQKIFISLFALILTVGLQISFMYVYFGQFRLSYVDDITWYRYCGTLTASIHKSGCFSKECYNQELSRRNNVILGRSLADMSNISKNDRYNAIINQTTSFWKAYKICLYTVIFGELNTSGVKTIDVFIQWTNAVLTILPISLALMVLVLKKAIKTIGEFNLIIIYILVFFILYTILTNAIAQYAGERLQIIYYPLSIYMSIYLIYKILDSYRNA